MFLNFWQLFAHGFGEVGRGVVWPERLMTLWIHSWMVTQCDSPVMAGNER